MRNRRRHDLFFALLIPVPISIVVSAVALLIARAIGFE